MVLFLMPVLLDDIVVCEHLGSVVSIRVSLASLALFGLKILIIPGACISGPLLVTNRDTQLPG